jgi:hypothetical protein
MNFKYIDKEKDGRHIITNQDKAGVSLHNVHFELRYTISNKRFALYNDNRENQCKFMAFGFMPHNRTSKYTKPKPDKFKITAGWKRKFQGKFGNTLN